MEIARVLKLSVALGIVCLFVVACGGADSSAGYPSSQITFINPYATGGSTDPLSRQFAQQLEDSLDTTIVVENRDGGSSTIGTGVVAEAEPDGYTIGLGSSTGLISQPLLSENLPYDSFEDLQPIVELYSQPAIIAVRDDAPWQTFDEFVEAARNSQGGLTASVPGANTTPDLTIKQFNEVADVDITPSPFSGGGGESITALLGGQVDAYAGYYGAIAGEVEAGEARVLTVFADERLEQLPDVSTAAELGYEDINTIDALFIVIAPQGLPENVMNPLVEASEEVISSEEFLQFVEQNGYTTDQNGPEELEERLNEQREIYRELLQQTGQL